MKSMIPYSNLLVLTAALSTQIAIPSKGFANIQAQQIINQNTQSSKEVYVNTELSSKTLIRFKEDYQSDYTVGYMRLFLYKEKRNIDLQNQLKPELWGYSSIITQEGHSTYSFLSEDIALDLTHQDPERKEYQIINCESTFSSCEYASHQIQIFGNRPVLFVAANVKVEGFNEQTQKWEELNRIEFNIGKNSK